MCENVFRNMEVALIGKMFQKLVSKTSNVY